MAERSGGETWVTCFSQVSECAPSLPVFFSSCTTRSGAGFPLLLAGTERVKRCFKWKKDKKNRSIWPTQFFISLILLQTIGSHVKAIRFYSLMESDGASGFPLSFILATPFLGKFSVDFFFFLSYRGRGFRVLWPAQVSAWWLIWTSCMSDKK